MLLSVNGSRLEVLPLTATEPRKLKIVDRMQRAADCSATLIGNYHLSKTGKADLTDARHAVRHGIN
ncbi:hypothetical protein D3871_21820 [Noviherbaspirillum saxi]|uniref:Uncharacterized protein n=1 Tax=Noviherbaspirillum saxi TaxID=2320863 RepID=A0A3A3FKD4_9BURK|nr:hypothetical protein D3871_21820 [Noviherbaspirillum saxi]